MFISKYILLKLAACVLLLAIVINSLLKWRWSTHGIIDIPLKHYDFIIVGGGTAGCVLARRLWESSNHTVLVVEAGTTAPWISAIPLLAPALQGYTADWGFKTVPQKMAQNGLNNRESAWPRGKVLGGTSILNYMLHMWGAKSDFDNYWSARAGPEWNSQGVRRYFQKAENYRRASRAPVPEVRGRRGPMPVTEFDGNSSVLAQAFLHGASSLGIEIGDLNGELENGATVSQSNTLNGWRVSAFDAYLDPVMEMSSIHLLTNTIAIKVIIESGRAVGVDTINLYSGKSYRIRAKKEIILSAGVIGSPHLLLLSGIGPRKHLRDLGIPVVSDLPGVGRNLRDHLNVPLYFHIDSPITTTTTKMRSLREVWKYFSKGKGFLAHSGVEAVVRLPSTGDRENGNKLFLMLFNLGSVNEPLFTSIANFKKDAFVETFPDSKNDSKEGFIMLASCTHPVSKGKILLKSVNFLDAPLIDPNYLSETEDVKCLIKAMKMAARLGTTEPLRRLGARLHLPGYSACTVFNQSLDDDRYLECWLRTSGITAYHPIGSCAMGPQDDPMAVLDSKLRLHKVKNLRVVDSSAFPHHTSGNPHAAVLMLAEKAADFILETVKRKQKAQKAAQ